LNDRVRIGSAHTLLALVAVAGERTSMRLLEFFAANIRNPQTRRAMPGYVRAGQEFLACCAGVGVASIGDIQPVRVAA
jgi:hypothetical protein